MFDDRQNSIDVKKAWRCPDGEVRAMWDILPKVPLSVRETFKTLLRARQEMILGGLALVPDYVQSRLVKIDPYLRCRWDFSYRKIGLDTPLRPCWVIERVDTSIPAWIKIMHYHDENEDPKPLGEETLVDIELTLRRDDLQRFPTIADYIAFKREEARLKRVENDKRGNEMVSAAVDKLGMNRIQQFIRVEHAIKTGEKIDVYGADAKFMNSVWEHQKRNGPATVPGHNEAINPGMAPGRYTRMPNTDRDM